MKRIWRTPYQTTPRIGSAIHGVRAIEMRSTQWHACIHGKIAITLLLVSEGINTLQI
jgi:hypothetical protein